MLARVGKEEKGLAAVERKGLLCKERRKHGEKTRMEVVVAFGIFGWGCEAPFQPSHLSHIAHKL
jgi:hypothetical protein